MERLEKLEVYQLAIELGEQIWDFVSIWEAFAKYTLGKQLVNACDSIANNISEGFGRYFYKENRQFCYYARGSLFEVYTQLTKAKKRGLISEENYSKCFALIQQLKPKLNKYILSIGNTKGE